MKIFSMLIEFFFDLFEIMQVTIGGFTFSLGGSVVFAFLVICSLLVINWLFSR